MQDLKSPKFLLQWTPPGENSLLKAIQASGETILEVELYSPGPIRPYCAVNWPTQISRRDGLLIIFQSYIGLKGGYKLPVNDSVNSRPIMNFKSEDGGVVESQLDTELPYEPGELVEQLFNLAGFNKNFPWFRFSSPFVDYSLDGEPMHGAPEKLFGVVGSQRLTAEIISLYKATGLIMISDEEMIQLGVQIETLTRHLPRLELLNT